MGRGRRALVGAGVSLLVALLALVVFLLLVVGRAGARIDSQARALSALAEGDDQLRTQVLRLGGTPNVPPPQVIISGVPGAVGEQGQQGPGPSQQQIADAVAAYLTLHPVPGASPSQVAAAVAAYLVASPPPPGPQGPGPSGQQIADAVASYMAANPAPSGPAGKDGSNGAAGSPPAGWSFGANGVAYDCVPDDGTPAPHYTCPPQSPSASPPASPSPSVSPPDSGSPPATATIAPTPPPTTSPAPTPLVSLRPLAPARTPTPPGPRSGLLLLAPSYLPLSRRTA